MEYEELGVFLSFCNASSNYSYQCGKTLVDFLQKKTDEIAKTNSILSLHRYDENLNIPKNANL